LSTIMRGEASQKIGHELAADAIGGVVAGGGVLTFMEAMVLAFCSVALTAALASVLFLQTSERLEPYEDLKQNSTKLVFPHAPLA